MTDIALFEAMSPLSFPRKRESGGPHDLAAGLDPRFRGGDAN